MKKQSPAPAEPPARRVPTQDRSRQRVERILDAAARTFAEVGFEAATTETIAERAGTSIGSVYQFFPNKKALYDAIAHRYLERSRALFEQLMAPEARTLRWDALLDLAIDAFAALDRDDADFRAVWINWNLSGEFFAAGQEHNRELARRVEGLLSQQAKGLAPSKRAVVATATVEVISAMLFLAARRDAKLAEGIIEETKVLLRRYLEPYAGAAASPARARKR